LQEGLEVFGIEKLRRDVETHRKRSAVERRQRRQRRNGGNVRSTSEPLMRCCARKKTLLENIMVGERDDKVWAISIMLFCYRACNIPWLLETGTS